jgi:hypothetical protein
LNQPRTKSPTDSPEEAKKYVHRPLPAKLLRRDSSDYFCS